MIWRRAAIALLGAMLVVAGGPACNDDKADDDFPRVVSLGDDGVYANILNSSLSIGPNRLLLQLNDADDERVFNATVRLRFFDLNGADAIASTEVDARFVPVETGYVDEQSGGAREVTGTDGVYVANVTFARAGDWGVKIAYTLPDDAFDEIPFRFTVRDRSDEPMIGDPAPPSIQQTLATASSIEEIDSSAPPRPYMHETTIESAVMSGSPAVIAFATPAFCRSRLCAPIMDTVMDPLAAAFGVRAEFIHVEPYLLRDLREAFVENPVPATLEWRLQSEPWIFVVDRQGRVSAKFEGIVALDEVRAALESALSE